MQRDLRFLNPHRMQLTTSDAVMAVVKCFDYGTLMMKLVINKRRTRCAVLNIPVEQGDLAFVPIRRELAIQCTISESGLQFLKDRTLPEHIFHYCWLSEMNRQIQMNGLEEKVPLAKSIEPWASSIKEGLSPGLALAKISEAQFTDAIQTELA